MTYAAVGDLRKELLIGCGSRRTKIISLPGRDKWEDVSTLDINSDHNPDVVWDLEKMPYPFKSNSFDEIHAYEVLEHIGDQGDWRKFFEQFSEFWRILRPGGFLMATVPSLTSPWLWSDPSHRRVIAPGTLTFLNQERYEKFVGKCPMSDFRFYYKADFKTVWMKDDKETFQFVLEARKG